MMWNGSTRGLSMKRQPEHFFFCCLDDRLYPHPLFLGVAVLNKSFLCLGISGIQVKFIGDII